MCACYASLRIALIVSKNEALSEQPGICFARQAEKQLPGLGECADYGPHGRSRGDCPVLQSFVPYP